KLVGIDHVGIGTDTQVGDHVGFHRVLLGRNAPDSLPAAYLDGLESPADGSNIIRGLIARGYEDNAIRKIAGQNALDFFRRTIGRYGCFTQFLAREPLAAQSGHIWCAAASPSCSSTATRSMCVPCASVG